MKDNFDIRPVRTLAPQAGSKAYIGKAASFSWPGLEVVIVAPDDAAVERACKKFGIPVDLLLVQEVAVMAPEVLEVVLNDGLSL